MARLESLGTEERIDPPDSPPQPDPLSRKQITSPPQQVRKKAETTHTLGGA